MTLGTEALRALKLRAFSSMPVSRARRLNIPRRMWLRCCLRTMTLLRAGVVLPCFSTYRVAGKSRPHEPFFTSACGMAAGRSPRHSTGTTMDPVTHNRRFRAIEVLSSAKLHSPLGVYKAVLDLRRNEPQPSDEKLLLPLLDYDDDMVVAAVLYSLVKVHGTPQTRRDLIMKFKDGDPRDTGQMPIQTLAIEMLAELAVCEEDAVEHLWGIAENREILECPRARAWECLARLAKLDWEEHYTKAMVWDPESANSERIRCRIRMAFNRSHH